eukprot:TRINITY_DN28907_c0_g1_i1.p1 TRINITY_DN28907_c0_g1~~TRINITY_DN28907_c0_g1_i1.p1  ORF type:complete len:104 (+),score=16.78 TRINITY_DN28907_c0_g1_i1:38-313(+)
MPHKCDFEALGGPEEAEAISNKAVMDEYTRAAVFARYGGRAVVNSEDLWLAGDVRLDIESNKRRRIVPPTEGVLERCLSSTEVLLPPPDAY